MVRRECGRSNQTILQEASNHAFITTSFVRCHRMRVKVWKCYPKFLGANVSIFVLNTQRGASCWFNCDLMNTRGNKLLVCWSRKGSLSFLLHTFLPALPAVQDETILNYCFNVSIKLSNFSNNNLLIKYFYTYWNKKKQWTIVQGQELALRSASSAMWIPHKSSWLASKAAKKVRVPRIEER